MSSQWTSLIFGELCQWPMLDLIQTEVNFSLFKIKNLPYPKDSLIQGGWPEEVAETYTGGGTPHLDGRHTVFGQLVDEESYKVLDEIAAVRVGAQDKPVDDVVIESVEIIEP